MILSGGDLQALRTALSCHAASDRRLWPVKARPLGSSDRLALAPRPGSMASRPRMTQWPSREGRRRRPATSAALAVKFGSLLSHQDLRATRSILWLRRSRQTYWTSTSPSASASRGPVQRANPCGAAYPEFKSACQSSSYKSAVCRAAACLAVLQGHGRHSDAAKG